MAEITRKELLDAIANDVGHVGEDTLKKCAQCEYFERIVHSCDDPTFKTEDTELLSAIKEDAKKAIAIIKSDSPNQTALEDYQKRIRSYVNCLKNR